jgi:hypothetical protein
MSDLQFDRAEPREPAAGLSCAGCAKSIADVYFEIGGKTFCEPCRQAAQAALEGGSGLGRLFRACLLGGLAAAVGALLYFGVAALFDLQLGLVSVVIGLLVGSAVRKGSDGRGGAGYRLLAVAITYLSISAAYTMLAFREKTADVPAFVVVLLAPVYPVLMWKESILSLLIDGFALYEAWKLNRRVEIKFSGPFRVGGPPGA